VASVSTSVYGYARETEPRPAARSATAERTEDAAAKASGAGPKRRATVSWFRVASAWGLAGAFLMITVFAVRPLSSAYLNAMADVQLETVPDPLIAQDKAARLYQDAIRADASNWRAYQGMGRLLHDDRRHNLVLEEKAVLAEQEKGWYELALTHNPKDPESLIALGRTLLFSSRIQLEDNERVAQEALGLQWLREACSLRKFNEQYWWILGIELRKSGQFEESLETFRRMETIKRTASSRANIQWLERNLAEPLPAERSIGSNGNKPQDSEKLMDSFELNDSGNDQSLDDLLNMIDR
jgi:tetratricopeptide (TPR) repeat protein